MRIVVFLPQIIYPDDTGGKKILLGLVMEFLDNNKKIKLICFNSTNENSSSLENFCKQHGIELIVYNPRYVKMKSNLSNRLIDYTAKLFKEEPKFYQNIMEQDFVDLVKKEILEEDIIYFGSIYFYGIFNILKFKNICYFMFHNFESFFIKEISKIQSNFLFKIGYYVESKKIEKLEDILFRDRNKYNFVFSFLTEEDRNEYKKKYNIADCRNLILNSNKLFPQKQILRNIDFKYPFLIFPGSIDFEPNFEAIKWFLDSTFPCLLDDYPDMKLVITGSCSSKKNLATVNIKNVIFTGYIEDDELNSFYSKCLCVISPILSGSGIKVKNIEAITRGIATVMTKFSAIGIIGSISKSKHIYISKDNTCSEYYIVLKRCIDEAYKNN